MSTDPGNVLPGDPDIAAIAALVGEPARARMLMALIDGDRLPASELTRICGIAKSTASEHLTRLLRHGLIASERCGRHTYYRITNPEVGHALEAMAVIATSTRPSSLRTVRRLDALARARLCYDHLAGRLGVAITDALRHDGLLHDLPDGRLAVDAAMWDARQPLGILAASVSGKRALARGCVDWTMRRPHLAGALGAALTAEMLRMEWIIRPRPAERALAVTAKGRIGITEAFGVPEGMLAEMGPAGGA